MFRWFMRVSVVVLCLTSMIVNIPVVEVASGEYGERSCRYVAIGESIARGYGLETPKNDSYPGLVAEWLKEQYDYVFYDNLGIDGLESKELLQILTDSENEKYNKFTKTLEDVDLVSVSIGGNDLMHLLDVKSGLDNMVKKGSDKYVKACDDLVGTFQKIVDRIHELAPNSRILVNTLYNPCHGLDRYQSVYSVADRYIMRLNEAYRKAKGVTVVDVHEIFAKSNDKLVNMAIKVHEIDPHPNQKGHELIARSVIAMLE